MFRFLPTPLHFNKTPTFINFSKRYQKFNFISICIKDRRQYLSRVLPILAVVWKDVIALYSCFEAFSVKKRILQRSGEGNQLTENNDNQRGAEEVEEHNQDMDKEDCPNNC